MKRFLFVVALGTAAIAVRGAVEIQPQPARYATGQAEDASESGQHRKRLQNSGHPKCGWTAALSLKADSTTSASFGEADRIRFGTVCLAKGFRLQRPCPLKDC